MDLGDLLFLLILLLPVLSRLFGKQQPQQKAPPRRRPDRATGTEEVDWQEVERPLPERDLQAEEDPLTEALRQIREALGEPQTPPERKPPEPARAETPPPKRIPPKQTLPKRTPQKPPRRTPRAAPDVREREFQGLGAFEHEEHGFGQSNPASEELFERRRPFGSEYRPAKQIPTGAGLPEPVDLETPLEVERVGGKQASAAASDPLRLLSDPRRAREAFVLKEVLGPPRSRRR